MPDPSIQQQIERERTHTQYTISRIQRGCLYAVKYRRYKVDPSPVILVLWADEHKVHALNMNYLSATKTEDVSSFVAKHMALVLNKYDAYKFYHRYIKPQIYPAISHAYRTYLTYELRSIRPVSANPLQTMSILRGMTKSRISAEAKGEKPATENKPRPVTTVVGPAREPEVVADYVDMLNQMFPKKQKTSTIGRIIGGLRGWRR